MAIRRRNFVFLTCIMMLGGVALVLKNRDGSIFTNTVQNRFKPNFDNPADVHSEHTEHESKRNWNRFSKLNSTLNIMRPKLLNQISWQHDQKSRLHGGSFFGTRTVENIAKTTSNSEATSTVSELDKEKQVLHAQRPSSLTIVSALLDVGRGNWSQYRRTMDIYQSYMDNVLNLRLPLVVFVDNSEVADYISQFRQRLGFEEQGIRTIIRRIHFKQLPYATFESRAQQILDFDQANWPPEWSKDMKTHPEATSAKYNILMASKIYLLTLIASENPFHTKQFAWLDAGYGHDVSSLFPPSYEWNPTFETGKISIIRRPGYQKRHMTLKGLYRQDIAPVAGGFIGSGDGITLLRLNGVFDDLFRRLLDQKMVDDDQTLMSVLLDSHPDLFDAREGDFFDVFSYWR